MNNKNHEVKRLNGIYQKLLDSAKVQHFEGRGKLLDGHRIEIELTKGGTTEISAKNICIATGNRAVMVPFEGAEYAINSDVMLCLEEPPKKLVVIGGGYIGIEFAGIYNNFGSEVHILYRSELPLKAFDKDCQAQVAENMAKDGIQLHPYSKIAKIIKKGEKQYVVVGVNTNTGEEFNLEANVILGAVGRKPNTDELNLEAAGVKLQEKSGAVLVNDNMQTNVPHIFGIGDVTDRIQLTPMAITEGMAVANTIFGPPENGKNHPYTINGEKADYFAGIGPVRPDHRLVATAVFAQPPLSAVGVTEEEAQKDFQGNIDIYTTKFGNLKSTLSGNQDKIFMKLIVHQSTDRVIGCHMVGDEAPEIMQSVAVALKAKALKWHFDTTIGIHPTTAEELVTMRTKARTIVG